MAGGFGPIRYIELEQAKPSRLRLFLIIIAIMTAAVAFTVGISSLLGGSSGWQNVEAYPDGIDCSADFTLQYEFVSGKADDTVSYKKLSALYTLAMEEACSLFYPQGELARMNANPNQVLDVKPALYRALESVQKSGNRGIYGAPLYSLYDQVFLCEDETQAARVDPNRDSELNAYAAQLARFAGDPAHIHLELLGDNQVRLTVSEEYLTFAAENEIDSFVDFGWMTNAFMVDYIAEQLLAGGYTTGYIASYDGFLRNLDNRGNAYGLNLFHRAGNEIRLPAVLSYTTPMSAVTLRGYPMSDMDRWHYFLYSDGGITTAMVNPHTGDNRSAVHELTACSADVGCAEILLSLSPIYFGETLDQDALSALAQRGITTARFENTTLFHTGDAATFSLTEDGTATGYQIASKD